MLRVGRPSQRKADACFLRCMISASTRGRMMSCMTLHPGPCSVVEIAGRALAGEGDQRVGRPLLVILGQVPDVIDRFLEPTDHT